MRLLASPRRGTLSEPARLRLQEDKQPFQQERYMAHPKEHRSQFGNSASLGMAPAIFNPMMTICVDLNATILEGFATAQKDWADFFQRRIREDVAVSRQLMHCQSLPDMNQIYSQYLQTAFEQYREQSEHVVQRSASMAQHLTETTEAKASEAARARH
jgi:hypothetical protein